MALTKEELWMIRREVARRYRSVDRTIEQGGEAPKAYGNWARPTIEKLLDTCFELYEKYEKEKRRT